MMLYDNIFYSVLNFNLYYKIFQILKFYKNIIKIDEWN